MLVGRNPDRLAEIAARHGLTDWTTDLDAALARDDVDIYFDAQLTQAREKAVRAAIAAGKHVYTEKPLADSAADRARAGPGGAARPASSTAWCRTSCSCPACASSSGSSTAASSAGSCPCAASSATGSSRATGRPRSARPGTTGPPTAAASCSTCSRTGTTCWSSCSARSGRSPRVVATHIPRRVDERGRAYDATADDAAYAIFELDGGIVAQINSSWTVRVHRDELVEFQVDGTHGSAVAGLRNCRIQHRGATPKPVWNPDLPATENFRDQWQVVPDNEEFDNGFKVQWEAFLRHVVEDAPFPWDFVSAARGVQLAELGLRSAREGRRDRDPGADRMTTVITAARASATEVRWPPAAPGAGAVHAAGSRTPRRTWWPTRGPTTCPGRRR